MRDLSLTPSFVCRTASANLRGQEPPGEEIAGALNSRVHVPNPKLHD